MKRRFNRVLSRRYDSLARHGRVETLYSPVSPLVFGFDLPLHTLPSGRWAIREYSLFPALFRLLVGLIIGLPCAWYLYLEAMGPTWTWDAFHGVLVFGTAIGVPFLLLGIREALVVRTLSGEDEGEEISVRIRAWPLLRTRRYHVSELAILSHNVSLVGYAAKGTSRTIQGVVLIAYFPDQAIALAAWPERARALAYLKNLPVRFARAYRGDGASIVAPPVSFL